VDKHVEVVPDLPLPKHGFVWLQLEELALATKPEQHRNRISLQELRLGDRFVDRANVCSGAPLARHT
jgi:hypothetical protein